MFGWDFLGLAFKIKGPTLQGLLRKYVTLLTRGMCDLWAVLNNKYRWGEDFYDAIFTFLLGVTYFHTLKHPLRARDEAHYVLVKNRRYLIENERAEKRKRV
eukprot:IDg18707t1